jgi:hypothetical protein
MGYWLNTNVRLEYRYCQACVNRRIPVQILATLTVLSVFLRKRSHRGVRFENTVPYLALSTWIPASLVSARRSRP